MDNNYIVDTFYDENFLYLLHYQAGKENLDILAEFLENNGLFVLWRLPFSNDWFSYCSTQHNASNALDRIFALSKQNIRNFNNAYFLLEIVYDFSYRNLLNKSILFLYSYVYNTTLKVSFSGIVWFSNKLTLGVNVYLPYQIISFLDFCLSLNLDFSWKIKEKHLQHKVETLISYII